MNIYYARQELKKKSIYDLPLRVVYYARVSTDKEEQKNSIINQKEHFEEFIKSNKNWKFCGGYVDDGISGIHAEKREEFQRMLSDAKAGKFDFIVTKEISRFARNTLDSIQYTRQLLSCGVCIWFQNDGINTIDDDSEFRLTIMAGVAQDEIRKLSSRVRFGHAQAIKNGVVLGNSHIYGYDKKDGCLTINPEEAEMVRLIFSRYATGAWSTPKLEKLLYEKGYRNYKGGRIDRGVIQHIITNPKYKGYYAGGKVKIIDMFTKKQEFLPEDEWNMFKDDGSRVPAIVEEDIWDKANEIFHKRGNAIKNRRSSFKTSNLFTGLIFCGNDDAPYWMKQRSIRGKDDVRWVCSHRIKNGASSCESFGLAESELKEIIAQVINTLEINVSDCVQRYVELFKRNIHKAHDGIDVDELKKKADDIKRKIDKILDYNLNGVLSDEEFILKKKEYTEQLNSITEKIRTVSEKDPSTQGIEAQIKKIQVELEKYRGIEAEDITLPVIHSLIEKIIVYPIAKKCARLNIKLKCGTEREEFYGCSGNMMLKIVPEQHIIFYRRSNRHENGKYPIKYEYSVIL